MKKCKHVLRIILFSCFFFLMMTLSAYANLPPEIYAPPDGITVSDKKITIPISIKDNPGLMGIKLRIDYPSDAFSSPVIMSKDLFANGMFENSITDSTNGSFDIVWSNTENVSKDGILFTIEFTRNDGFTGEKSIVILNYYPDDTFNENWDSVAISCDNILLKFDGENVKTDSVTNNSQPITADEERTVPTITEGSLSSSEMNNSLSKDAENTTANKDFDPAATEADDMQNTESSITSADMVLSGNDETPATDNEEMPFVEETTNSADVTSSEKTTGDLTEKTGGSVKHDNTPYYIIVVFVITLMPIALLLRKKVKSNHEKNA